MSDIPALAIWLGGHPAALAGHHPRVRDVEEAVGVGYEVEIERDTAGRAARLVFIRTDNPAPDNGVTPHAGADLGILACVCGRPLTGRRGSRYCSRRCKDAAYNAAHPVARQRALPLDPPPAILPPVRDQRVPKPRRRHFGEQAAAILARLEEGPASNAELALMFPPATAWRSRLSDARWELRRRHGLRDEDDPIPGHDCGNGLVWHWLDITR